MRFVRSWFMARTLAPVAAAAATLVTRWPSNDKTPFPVPIQTVPALSTNMLRASAASKAAGGVRLGPAVPSEPDDAERPPRTRGDEGARGRDDCSGVAASA